MCFSALLLNQQKGVIYLQMNEYTLVGIHTLVRVHKIPQ